MAEQLRQQIQQRSSLLRQSAHDLKSSFIIIQGATHLLNQAQTEAQRRQAQNMLERNIHQASQLLTQLLDVTRLEAGEEQRELTSFDTGSLLSELIESVQPLADKKGLWIRKQGMGSLLIESDWVKLYRIVQNLLLNAIQYTKMGGITLTWECATAGQKWSLSVADTGPGLSAGGHQIGGEGIGLLIVQQLCSLLEGQLTIEHPNEGGTRFRVCFPLHYSS